MAYKVCLLDSDSAYQRALMQYLNMRASIPVQLYAFTSAESFYAFRETMVPELLLLGEEYAQISDSCPTCILSRRREYMGSGKVLFRYQNADALVREMLSMIEETQKKTVGGGVCYAVYSPVGRCGKSTLARAVCHRYTQSLYINWEGIAAQTDAQMQEDAGNELLYCMKSRNETYTALLEDGAYTAIPPPEAYSDIRQIEVEDLEWFREEIRKKTKYEVVVFDIGTMVLRGYELLTVFDRVLVPVLPDAVSKDKLEWFEKALTRACGQLPQLQYVQMEGEPVEEIVERYVR